MKTASGRHLFFSEFKIKVHFFLILKKKTLTSSKWVVSSQLTSIRFALRSVVLKGTFKAELKYLKCGTLLTMKYVLLTCLSL